MPSGGVHDEVSDVLGYLGDDGVSESAQSVHPGGYAGCYAGQSVFPAGVPGVQNRAGIRPLIGSPRRSSAACQKL